MEITIKIETADVLHEGNSACAHVIRSVEKSLIQRGGLLSAEKYEEVRAKIEEIVKIVARHQ